MKYYDAVRFILGIPDLTSGAKVVLLSLFDRQGRKQRSWPSVDTIGKDCGLARTTILRAIKELVDKKLLIVKRPDKPAVGRTNNYSVHLTSIESKPIQKRDQYRNATQTGSDSGLQPVAIQNPNDLIERQIERNNISLSPAAAPGSKEAESAFEKARQLYPGTKRSGTTEFKDFQRHKDWRSAASLLAPAIQREIEHKAKLKAAEKFCPEWKNFKSWIYQRCWEQEFPDTDENQLTHECDPEVAMALEKSLML